MARWRTFSSGLRRHCSLRAPPRSASSDWATGRGRPAGACAVTWQFAACAAAMCDHTAPLLLPTRWDEPLVPLKHVARPMPCRRRTVYVAFTTLVACMLPFFGAFIGESGRSCWAHAAGSLGQVARHAGPRGAGGGRGVVWAAACSVASRTPCAWRSALCSPTHARALPPGTSPATTRPNWRAHVLPHGGLLSHHDVPPVRGLEVLPAHCGRHRVLM